MDTQKNLTRCVVALIVVVVDDDDVVVVVDVWLLLLLHANRDRFSRSANSPFNSTIE